MSTDLPGEEEDVVIGALGAELLLGDLEGGGRPLEVELCDALHQSHHQRPQSCPRGLARLVVQPHAARRQVGRSEEGWSELLEG